MNKIEIKNPKGNVIYSYECENNTIRKTLEQAAKEGVHLNKAQLQGVDISGACLVGAQMTKTNFSGANLKRINARFANFRGSDFSNANVNNSSMMCCWLGECNFFKTNLEGSDLRGTNIAMVDIFKWTNFSNAYFCENWDAMKDISSAITDNIHIFKEEKIDINDSSLKELVGTCYDLIPNKDLVKNDERLSDILEHYTMCKYFNLLCDPLNILDVSNSVYNIKIKIEKYEEYLRFEAIRQSIVRISSATVLERRKSYNEEKLSSHKDILQQIYRLQVKLLGKSNIEVSIAYDGSLYVYIDIYGRSDSFYFGKDDNKKEWELILNKLMAFIKYCEEWKCEEVCFEKGTELRLNKSILSELQTHTIKFMCNEDINIIIETLLNCDIQCNIYIEKEYNKIFEFNNGSNINEWRKELDKIIEYTNTL